MTGPISPEHAVLLIRLTSQYTPDMSREQLYDSTRRWWRIGPRRERVDYTFAVHGGVVQACYAVDGWEPAPDAREGQPPRWGFWGRAAPELESTYVGVGVSGYFPRGAQTPFTYVNVP